MSTERYRLCRVETRLLGRQWSRWLECSRLPRSFMHGRQAERLRRRQIAGRQTRVGKEVEWRANIDTCVVRRLRLFWQSSRHFEERKKFSEIVQWSFGGIRLHKRSKGENTANSQITLWSLKCYASCIKYLICILYIRVSLF